MSVALKMRRIPKFRLGRPAADKNRLPLLLYRSGIGTLYRERDDSSISVPRPIGPRQRDATGTRQSARGTRSQIATGKRETRIVRRTIAYTYCRTYVFSFFFFFFTSLPTFAFHYVIGAGRRVCQCQENIKRSRASPRADRHRRWRRIRGCERRLRRFASRFQ